MSPDPTRPAAPARPTVRRAGVDALERGSGPLDLTSGSRPSACTRGFAPVDEPRWCGWWRDLVIERYRSAPFERALPLAEGGSCPWIDRVRLGRLVDDSLAGVHGAGATARLLADALGASGYGPLSDPTVDRRSAQRLAPWNPMRAGDDDLRLGILGTIADALLRRDLPSAGVDGGVTEVIVTATRSAVLAYACHVEALAVRTRRSVQYRRDDHSRACAGASPRPGPSAPLCTTPVTEERRDGGGGGGGSGGVAPTGSRRQRYGAAMRRIADDERRARLGRRHLLASRGPSVAGVAEHLVALHATDPPSVYLSCFARLAEPTVAAVDVALYDDRSLVRMLGMRRTVFVVGADLAMTVEAACTTKIAAVERRKLVGRIEASGVSADGERWLRDVAASIATVLADRGEASAIDLAKAVPELARPIVIGAGTKNEAEVRASSHVLAVLAAEGTLVRGRPAGSWTGTQYRWAEREQWLGRRLEPVDPDAARSALARRYLSAFAPVTMADLVWWTGWTKAHAAATAEAIGAVEVELDVGTGLVLPDDLEPVTAPDRWAALLPALDPTPMGWTDRAWFLGPHRERLFDRSGNIGPTVWVDGRIVGGWARRPDGTIAIGLLDDVASAARSAIDAQVTALAELLADTNVSPKFRTPLERELATS